MSVRTFQDTDLITLEFQRTSLNRCIHLVTSDSLYLDESELKDAFNETVKDAFNVNCMRIMIECYIGSKEQLVQSVNELLTTSLGYEFNRCVPLFLGQSCLQTWINTDNVSVKL